MKTTTLAMLVSVLSGCNGAPMQQQAGPPVIAATIGPAGGEITGANILPGFSLTVPPGALQSDTTIQVHAAFDETSLPSPLARRTGTLFEIDGGGATLSAPLQVTLPFDPAIVFHYASDGAGMKVWTKADGANDWVRYDSPQIGQNTVTLPLASFGEAGAGLILPPLAPLCNAACVLAAANGCSNGFCTTQLVPVPQGTAPVPRDFDFAIDVNYLYYWTEVDLGGGGGVAVPGFAPVRQSLTNGSFQQGAGIYEFVNIPFAPSYVQAGDLVWSGQTITVAHFGAQPTTTTIAADPSIEPSGSTLQLGSGLDLVLTLNNLWQIDPIAMSFQPAISWNCFGELFEPFLRSNQMGTGFWSVGCPGGFDLYLVPGAGKAPTLSKSVPMPAGCSAEVDAPFAVSPHDEIAAILGCPTTGVVRANTAAGTSQLIPTPVALSSVGYDNSGGLWLGPFINPEVLYYAPGATSPTAIIPLPGAGPTAGVDSIHAVVDQPQTVVVLSGGNFYKITKQ